MVDEFRESAMSTPCPHCGGRLTAIEVGYTPAEFDHPVAWRRTGHRCVNRCDFVAGDLAVDAP